MKSSTKRIITILISGSLLLGSVLVFTYLIQPSYEDIAKSRGKLAGLEKTKSELEDLQKKVNQLLAKYQDVINKKESINSVLPSEQNLSGAVNQVTGLAALNRLGIESLSVQQLAVKPSDQPAFARGIGTLRINLRLNGNYESLRSFIENLETNINLMDIVNLKVDPTPIIAGKKFVSDEFTYVILIDTYYQTD